MAYKYIKGKNKIRGEQTFVDNLSGSQTISASYFVGDGSGLTNVSASGGGGISSVYTTGSVTGSGLVINPITLKDPLVIGAVTASIGFSGNLYGTASNAVQAQTASVLTAFNQSNYLTTSSFNTFTASYNTGSFSGSFIGTTAQFTTLTASSIVSNGGFVSKRTSISIDTTLNSSQHIIGVDTATAATSLTLSLPNASTLASGQVYIVKDEGGMADTKTITISCSVGSQTIDGNSTIIIESPYAAVNIYCNGLDKYFIY